MALSIKTEEADRLARELARLTGETLTEAITAAMRERLDRLRADQEMPDDYAARVRDFVRQHGGLFDRRPVTREEWDAASGEDTGEDSGENSDDRGPS
jgi:antitoxin VapB